VVDKKMESRRQEMSLEQRQLAVDLYLRGGKQNRFAEIFSVNKSTISRLIKKFQKEKKP
jgi:transposase